MKLNKSLSQMVARRDALKRSNRFHYWFGVWSKEGSPEVEVSMVRTDAILPLPNVMNEFLTRKKTPFGADQLRIGEAISEEEGARIYVTGNSQEAVYLFSQRKVCNEAITQLVAGQTMQQVEDLQSLSDAGKFDEMQDYIREMKKEPTE